MSKQAVAGVATALVILGLAGGCVTMPQATGRIMVQGGEPAIATVLAFAAAPEIRAEVTKQSPVAETAEIGLRRHRNTFVLDVTASASDPTAAKSAAESMLNSLKQKFPGPGEPRVEILENVKVVGQ